MLSVAVVIAIAGFAFVSSYALGGARLYLQWGGGCGNDRIAGEQYVFVFAPLGFATSGLAWLLARGGDKAFMFCRTAFFGALGQWLVAVAFILSH